MPHRHTAVVNSVLPESVGQAGFTEVKDRPTTEVGLRETFLGRQTASANKRYGVSQSSRVDQESANDGPRDRIRPTSFFSMACKLIPGFSRAHKLE